MSVEIEHLYRFSWANKQHTRAELHEIRREINSVLDNVTNEHVEETIINIVCDHFGLSREALLSKARPEHIAWPRQIAMVLIYEHTDFSTNEVKRIFGKKDHGTVLYARGVVELRERDCLRDARAIKTIRRLLKESLQSIPAPNGVPLSVNANGHGEQLDRSRDGAGVGLKTRSGHRKDRCDA